jgi:CubicO group peptidase (beta-lactamase class C family)
VVPTVPVPPDKRWDWETRTAALAEQEPAWEPGTRSEYHGGTFGYLVGEVVRPIDGRSLAPFFRDEIAEPLGADFMIGLGPEHDRRCAEMVGLPAPTFGHTGLGGSIGLADPTNRLGFGYVMNQMGRGGATDLLIATYRSLAG